MSSKGWFSINREIFDHWLWDDKPFTKGQAWIDLIGLANHKDTDNEVRGKLIKCKRGDVNRSLRFLAERWGWSVGKVKRYIDVLETEQMVKQKQNNGETVITIEKYNKYQANHSVDGTETEHETEHRRNTNQNTDGTQTEHRRNTNNNVNNYNNYNNSNNYRYGHDNDNDIDRVPNLRDLAGSRAPSDEEYEKFISGFRRDDLGGKTAMEFMNEDD